MWKPTFKTSFVSVSSFLPVMSYAVMVVNPNSGIEKDIVAKGLKGLG